MNRKQITSLLLGLTLTLVAILTPFAQLPAYTAENEVNASENNNEPPENIGESLPGEATDTQDEIKSENENPETDESHIYEGIVSVMTEGQEIVPKNINGESPDKLFADYVEKSFYGETSEDTFLKNRSEKNTASALNGIDRVIYDKIASALPQIAAGERASTVFDISVDEFGLEKTAWTAEELSVASIWKVDEKGEVIVNGSGEASISEDALEAVGNMTDYDLSIILNSLLADYPFHFYWYDNLKVV